MSVLDGKVAVVTGAGTGVGRASSIALSAAGFRLVLAGRRRELLNDTKLAIGYTDRLIGLKSGELVLDEPSKGMQASDLDELYSD